MTHTEHNRVARTAKSCTRDLGSRLSPAINAPRVSTDTSCSTDRPFLHRTFRAQRSRLPACRRSDGGAAPADDARLNRLRAGHMYEVTASDESGRVETAHK
jgi:hypothetical protein